MTTRRLANYYAQRAAEYEEIYSKPERQEDLQRLRSMVEAIFPARDVLEVACGTGYWTEVAARSSSSLLAIDINASVLAIAQAKGLKGVTWCRADSYRLPVAEEQFTGGLGMFWLSHIPKERLGGFLKDFHEILAPGAVVMFADNRYVEGNSTPVSRRDPEGNSYQNRRLKDGSWHEVLKNFPTPDELCAAVDGLAADVMVEVLPYHWILTYRVPGDSAGGYAGRASPAPRQ